jgi:plastocyanin
MRRLARLVVAGAVAVAALSALGAPASTGATKLVGTTGPSFTISLRKGGKTVKTLPAGKYTITVRDRSADHNLRLRGPRMNKLITSLPFTGTKTVMVRLRKGRYTYLCDPHEFGGMKGTFRVT